MGKILSLPGKIMGGLTGATDAAKGAEQASALQYQAQMAGVDEQRRQYDQMRKLMEPYTQIGPQALDAYSGLIGLRGPQVQQEAIGNISQSPHLQALMQQGENAILQNASATGGLRGGNTQAALAQFRPNFLQSILEQQYGQLGGLASMGQNAAAGVGNQGIQMGANVANLMNNAAAAQAGGIQARANVGRQGFSDAMAILGAATGMKGVFR